MRMFLFVGSMLVSPYVAYLLNDICVAEKKCFRLGFYVEVLGDRKFTQFLANLRVSEL